MKILILALSGIGDALMFTPGLRLLRKARPKAQIHALVMFPGVKDIYSSNPDLDKIIFYNFLQNGALKSFKFVMSLRGRYDLSINVYPSNRKEYNIISFLLGAKKRAAVEYLRANKQNLGWLNNITIKEDDALHNVNENINLVRKTLNLDNVEEPKLQLDISGENRAFAEQFLKSISIIESELVIGFHPGCATLKNQIKRRWEPEKFAELGRKLIEKNSATILLFGGPEEEELKEKISNQIKSEKVFIVKTPDLMKSAAIIKRCNAFVTNDSSLMHIASALGLKVIAIIGPTNTNYIHPWKTEHKIVSLNLECSPCFFYSPRPLTCSRTDVKFKCIKELSVDMVYNSTIKFISQENVL
ncbi:MAG: glycosyltransferase family 9 protein [Ignavibacteriaceae bacterium]